MKFSFGNRQSIGGGGGGGGGQPPGSCMHRGALGGYEVHHPMFGSHLSKMRIRDCRELRKL